MAAICGGGDVGGVSILSLSCASTSLPAPSLPVAETKAAEVTASVSSTPASSSVRVEPIATPAAVVENEATAEATPAPTPPVASVEAQAAPDHFWNPRCLYGSTGSSSHFRRSWGTWSDEWGQRQGQLG